jgi:hypothetical protein
MALNPQQQAALDLFEQDAEEADTAHQASASAIAAAFEADRLKASTAVTDLDAHAKALESARQFVDLMVPPTPTPTPASPQAVQKPK